MPQCPFSYKTALIDSAATDHYTQPSAPLLNHRTLKDDQPIYFTNGGTIKASQAVQLPNLPMVSAEFTTAQACENINNVSLIS